MSGEVGKRGGGVRKMMNSENLEREREKKKRKAKKNVFCVLAANRSEFVQNNSSPDLTTCH